METTGYKRGAFAVYDQDDSGTAGKQGGSAAPSRFIPFRFNPETLSRQLSIEQGENKGGAAAPGGTPANGGGEQGADASSGTLKEVFSVLIRFDLVDRVEAGSGMPAEYGVLPEISALEDLMYSVEAVTQKPSDGSEAVLARPQRPTILFLWGDKRVVPVRITGMTINETLFNSQLYPVRAEVDVGLQVLGEAEARGNNRVRSAMEFTAAGRRELARLFFDNTSKQGSTLSPP